MRLLSVFLLTMAMLCGIARGSRSYLLTSDEFLANLTGLGERRVHRLAGSGSDMRMLQTTPALAWTGELQSFRFRGKAGGGGIRVMAACGMHAREPFTSDLCAEWMRELAREQPRRKNDWLFVPVANPQGRDIVVKRGLLGKDATASCHRGNAAGVDLNRNWPRRAREPAQNVTEAIKRLAHGRALLSMRRSWPAAARREDASVYEYPGPEPMSEPETRLLATLIERFSPHVLLSVHTGYRAILVPYESEPHEDAPNYPELMRLAEWLADAVDCGQDRCAVGPAARHMYALNGTMTEWAFVARAVPYPLTLEVYAGAPETRHPLACFAGFNPLKAREFRETVARWAPLPERLEDAAEKLHLPISRDPLRNPVLDVD